MSSRAGWLLSIVLLVVSAFPVGAQDFSIEEVMSAPMPSGLVASPEGGAVAWVQTEQGVRNVYVATSPDYRGRKLTAYSDDDGHGLGGLQFTADGASIVYSRGGDPNRQGQFPNPRSFTETYFLSSYIIPVAGGEPRKLPNRGGLVLSPDGETAIYSSEGAVFRIRLTDGAEQGGEEEKESEPEKLFQVRNGAGSLFIPRTGSRRIRG